MDALAAALVLCTVLYLVDKNHLWGRFWKFLMWSTVLSLVGLLLVIGYIKHEANAATKAIPIPSDATIGHP